MRIWFLRHGETDWNVQHLYQGCTDIPLNENGRELARLTGKGMQDISFDLCITSPLVRAAETAALILKENRFYPAAKELISWPGGTLGEHFGMRFYTDARIKEIRFGIWEGLCYQGPNYNLPLHRFSSIWDDLYDEETPEGAERKLDLVKRVSVFLDALAEHFGGTDCNILIVSHGGVCRALNYILEGDIRTPTRNCSAAVLDYDEGNGYRITERRAFA